MLGYGDFITVVKSHRIFAQKDITLGASKQNKLNPQMEQYFKLVCPQILSILEREDNTDNKMYHVIACHCIRTLTERSLILSRRYILGMD